MFVIELLGFMCFVLGTVVAVAAWLGAGIPFAELLILALYGGGFICNRIG